MTFQFILAARYLWGRKLRSFLTTLAVMFGTLVIFGMNILLPTMIDAFKTNLLAASGQVDVTITHRTGEAFAEKTLSKVRDVAGIRAIAPSLSRNVNIPTDFYSPANITALTLTGVDPRAAQTVRTYLIREGRFLRLSDDSAAVITASLADDLGVRLGDKFDLPTPVGNVPLRVVGILPARALPGNEEVLVTLYDAQKWLDLPDRINTIEINLTTTDSAQRAAIQHAIETALGKDYTLGGLSDGTDLLASMQMGQAAFNLFGFLALFMGGFIIFNTFRTIVTERRHDIGMLRAVGANRRTIIGLIVAEGLLQGVVGTALGMGLGYLMGAGLLVLMEPIMNQYLHLALGGPVIEPSLIITTVVLGVGVTLVAGLLPALTASRVTPLEALRPSVAEAGQRTLGMGTLIGAALIVAAGLGLLSGDVGFTALGGLAFLIGLMLVAPVLVKPIASVFSVLIALAFAREGTGTLAQGNLTRQPSRAAITASATMIGLAIIVGVAGVIWSISGGFLGVLERSLGSDYLLMPPSVGIWGSDVGAQQDLAQRLRAVPGVEVVSTMRFAAAEANGKSVSLLGIDPEVYPRVASLTFQQGDSRTAYYDLTQGRTIIANGLLAAQLEVGIGDSVRLSTPTGSKDYQIVGVAGDYLNAKIATAYISQESLARDFRKTEDIFIQLNLAPNADATRVEARMDDIVKDYPQFKLVSGKSYFEETKQLFNFIFVFYFVILGVLALPSLIALLNTLAIGVLERTREIGMLRAIGATRRQVGRMVVAESLLLAAIGTALGMLAGLYLGYVMVLGLSSGGYPITYAFPYAGLVAAIAVGLIFGVVAAMLPARQAARMEIIRALRFE